MMPRRKVSTRSLRWQNIKKRQTCKVLIVTGCMAQRYKNEIIEEVPEVDAVLGTTSYGDILKASKRGNGWQTFPGIQRY